MRIGRLTDIEEATSDYTIPVYDPIIKRTRQISVYNIIRSGVTTLSSVTKGSLALDDEIAILDHDLNINVKITLDELAQYFYEENDPTWGDIVGTLSDQADLKAELDLRLEKAPSAVTPSLMLALDSGSSVITVAEQPNEPRAAPLTSVSVPAGSDTVDITAFNGLLTTLLSEVEGIRTAVNNTIDKLRNLNLISTDVVLEGSMSSKTKPSVNLAVDWGLSANASSKSGSESTLVIDLSDSFVISKTRTESGLAVDWVLASNASSKTKSESELEIVSP